MLRLYKGADFLPYTKTKIYISYQHKDFPIAAKIKTALSNRGFSVWWDLDLNFGDDWLNAISGSVKEHSYKNGLFLCLVGGEYDSLHVQRELDLAIQHGSLVLPVCIERNGVDAFDCLPIQPFFLDMDNFDEGIKHLIDAINKL